MRRLAVIADLHFGAAPAERVAALERAMHAVSPDVIVAAGDFTQRGRVGEFEAAAGFLRRLPRPIVAVPGNHDIPSANLYERVVRPLGRYRDAIGAQTVDRYRDEEVAVIGVNSARPWGLHWNWAHGRVSGRDIRAAAGWLAERPSGAYGAVVVHHPPVLFARRRGFRRLGRGSRLLAAARGCGAGAVLSGHLHSAGWREVDGLLHVHVGTSASRRLRGEVNAFCVLEIGPASVEVGSWAADAGGEFVCVERARLERERG